MKTTTNTGFRYANRVLFSDVIPYEIVRHISGKSLAIRPMHTEMIIAPKAHTGGFAANFDNNQEYEYKSAPELAEVIIRLHKDGVWRCKKGNRYVLNDRPVKFHDFNF